MGYFDLLGLNQSSLKRLLNGSPENFIKKEEQLVTPIHFVFGSAVDVIALEGKEEFEKQFYVTDHKLGDKERYIVESVYNESDLLELDDDDLIMKYAKEIKFQPRWLEATVLENIKKAGKSFYKDLSDSGSKTIIHKNDASRAFYCAGLLRGNKYTSECLYPEDGEILTKVVLKFDIDGVECKGEIDQLVIDHKNKRIIPIDLKTTGSDIYTFTTSFWKYRYDIQAAFYKNGVEECIKNKVLPDKYKDYTVEKYRFVVIESYPKHQPMVFEVDDDVENIGKFGGVLSNGKKLEGYTQLIDRYKYHMKEDKWEYPREYYENSGVLKITK